MNATEKLSIDGDGTHSGLVIGFHARFTRRLEAIAAFLDARPWTNFIVIAFLYLAYLASHATARPLWHDELFTYYIAQARTFGQMLQQTRTIDLNPPLYYAAARLVFKFLPPSAFSVRLPSMIAFLLATICLYFFVRRRLTPIYGLLAALVLLGSLYKSYAVEARPYAFILAFLGIAALGWQRAIQDVNRSRWRGLLLMILGAIGMLLSHVLAAIAYGGFFVAELARFLDRRKTDWLLWICLVVPISPGFLFLPLIRNHSTGIFPSAFQASFLGLVESYGRLWISVGTLFASAVIVIVLFANQDVAPSARKGGSGFTIAEGAFAAYLIFVPTVIAVIFMASHSAYFDRYGIPAIFGASILVPWFIATWTRTNRLSGVLAAFVFAFGVVPPVALVTYGKKLIHKPEPHSYAVTGDSPVHFTQVEQDLPFVDASGLTFLEMDSREDGAFLSRVYYLTDPQLALKYSHATIFDGFGALKHIFPIRANAVPYRQFLQQHSKFLVYGTLDYPEDWLLRKLLADGAIVRLLGNFPGGYKDSMLYEITLPRQSTDRAVNRTELRRP